MDSVKMAAIESSTLAAYVQKALGASKEHPVLAFPKDPLGANNFHRYTVAELKQLADQAATQYVSHGLHPRQKGEKPLVVGVLAPGDIKWAATFLAVVQMGHTFLGKPTCSEAARATIINTEQSSRRGSQIQRSLLCSTRLSVIS